MSLHDLLQKIGKWISGIFRDIPKHIQEFITAVIPVISDLRTKIESEEAIDLTTLIPGTWDDDLRKDASVFLAWMLEKLNALQGEKKQIMQDASVDQRLTRGQTLRLSAIEKDMKNKYIGSASWILAHLDGNTLPENIYDSYMQVGYSETVKNR